MSSSRGGAESLAESNIPGASLDGRDPNTLNVQALKRWLECRRAPTKGRKAELVERVNSYIRNGWDKLHLCDPDNTVQASASDCHLSPTDGWKDLIQTYTAGNTLDFTNAHIITYFVTRTADDGLPAGDFKSVNSSASYLFRCGHVQRIQVSHEAGSSTTFFRADCLPEMRKDRIYKLEMKIDLSDIAGARCGCPAGKGPKASCKHIAALCYALEDFARCRKLPEYITCTDKLQEWNQPRPRKLKAVSVESLSERKSQLTDNKRTIRTALAFDPRPTTSCIGNHLRTEQLRCSLLAMNKPCGFLHILVPDVTKIRHDHTYSSDSISPSLNISSEVVSTSSVDMTEYGPRTLSQSTIDGYYRSIRLDCRSRQKIEVDTRKQGSSMEWHAIRANKITGSICGRILLQKKKTIPLLRQCLYKKPLFDPLPAAIAWGRQKESTAHDAYVKHMHSKGHHSLRTTPCGFIIHPTKGWLGASPDAKVLDDGVNGIAEFKCPYTKRDQSPLEACSDPGFCCDLISGNLHLKRHHQYYHQVQLQLYVSKNSSFCDFCVYTPVGSAVERILPDKVWQETHIPELEEYFNNFMLPEILDPVYKPSYIL